MFVYLYEQEKVVGQGQFVFLYEQVTEKVHVIGQGQFVWNGSWWDRHISWCYIILFVLVTVTALCAHVRKT